MQEVIEYLKANLKEKPKELKKLEDLKKELEQIKEIKKKDKESRNQSLRIKYTQLKAKAEKIKHKDGTPINEEGKKLLQDIKLKLNKYNKNFQDIKQIEQSDETELTSLLSDINDKLIEQTKEKEGTTLPDLDEFPAQKTKEHTIEDIQEKAEKLKKKALETEWDKYYMKLACLAALRSKEPRTPVS